MEWKTLDNGVIMGYHSNKLVHTCNYCGTVFYPKRRFVQKYCTESCRVLACRKRINGLMGTMGGNYQVRDKTTNTALANIITENIPVLVKNTFENIDYRLKIIEGKTDIIQTRQLWHMVISVLSPMLAPEILKILKNIFTEGDKEPQNYQEFESIFNKKTKDIPLNDDMKNVIKQAVNAYFNTKNNPFNV
ncbi:hypothetical protein RZS08_05815 [Arthrospira platensis SPKY1]|nr:hypothetical protein [Arthrospira platensis SPKY1]